jgi:hypothetical protein
MILYTKRLQRGGLLLPIPSSEIKEHSSRIDYTMPTSMRVRKDTPAELEQARQQRIMASVQAAGVPWRADSWRDKLAMETSATADKLSLQSIPKVGKYIPGFLDAGAGIGHMVSSIGSAPLRAQETNSIKPYLYAVGAPLLTGAVAGIGAGSTAEFANNMVNPLAGMGIRDGVKRMVTRKFIPIQKTRILPDEMSTTIEHIADDKMHPTDIFSPNMKIKLIGKDKAEYGRIELREKPKYILESGTEKVALDPITKAPLKDSPEWLRPIMVKVDPALRGNNAQDVLYQLGIEEAKKKGLRGIYSGEDLMMPQNTVRAYPRFNKEVMGSKTTTYLKEIEPGLNIQKSVEHDIVGLTGHKNPNIVADWMKEYKNINKFSPREYISIQEMTNFIAKKIAAKK